jgi:hypothetical protein
MSFILIARESRHASRIRWNVCEPESVNLAPRLEDSVTKKKTWKRWSVGPRRCARLLFAVCLLSATAGASILDLSYTGTLANPETAVDLAFTLTTASIVAFQTWGFGGGTNAAGQANATGGFDPLISLFAGSGPNINILTDGVGDPLADADNLLNAPWSFVGNCPPAGTVSIGGNQDCGDDYMPTGLSAGTYTLVLTDANYIPLAVYDNGNLNEGFSDLTGGVFQTCDPNNNVCITTNGNYAVDIVSSGLAVPEAATLPLLGVGLAALAAMKQFSKRRRAPKTIGGKI